jgi:predicted DNA binding CopG/RHH family protein
MSGTKKKTKVTKKSTVSASRKLKRSSKTPGHSSAKIETALKNREALSSDTQTKTDISSLSSLKRTSKKTLESSQQEKLPTQKKNPWDGYDFEELPPLDPKQLGTLKRVSRQEFDQLKRGRPRKPIEEKFQSVTLRIEPHLLNKIKKEAKVNGIPWQTFFKVLIQKGLSASSLP